jgi:adenine-specific DNA-methyltransferase
MEPIRATSPESRSVDIVAENIQKLKALFPEFVTEGERGASINVDTLKALVGDRALTDCDEKYGLNWFGKRQARELALTPSTGTLRPCPEDSVDWDNTKNIMIEGDNLEVLKLLQKSYAGKVKLIYIDPPYNTGKDFVYPDNFQDNIRNYLELTGQIEGGRKLEANTDSSGRFHTDWLSMMYPRLKIAKSLLNNEGVIFISIDDGEVANLREIMNEIFGEENFLASFVWKSRQNKDNRNISGASIDHEYIICYGNSIKGSGRDLSQYSNPDNDPRGDWTSANMVGIATIDRRPNLHYDLINPATGINYGCPKMGWRYEPKTMNQLIFDQRIIWPSLPTGRPRRKSFVSELDSEFTGYSTIIGEDVYTRDGTIDLDELFKERIFSFPKPIKLIAELLEQGSNEESIILDFFAGSGTTGHAVMAQNAADGGNRRYILVQLPEPLDPDNKDQKTAADYCKKLGKPLNIAELTKERLRRAGKKIAEENPLFQGDLGFRVFKLDSSNIRAWNPNPSDLETALLDSVDHIKSDRSEQDILYELLLKLGLDLAVPIVTRTFGGKDVHAIGAGSLFVCLSDSIRRDDVESLALGIVAWRKELNPAGEVVCVFRDSGFEDNVAKTNLSALLSQHDIGNVRSL